MSVGKESILFGAGSVSDISDTEGFASEKPGYNIGSHRKSCCKTDNMWPRCLLLLPSCIRPDTYSNILICFPIWICLFFFLNYHDLEIILFHMLGLSFQQQLFFLAWASRCWVLWLSASDLGWLVF